ncbi:MAG: 4Fe-4S binding protein [Candidatus Lokiarchaeota archaeon]|nr:4Fe-4S binding protein [Candidatus Lokiarchaeota archaeon]
MSKSESVKASGEIYRQLQLHLDELPTGFPATKSGVEIRLLKKIFNLEEAKIATMLKFGFEKLESLDDIFARLKPLGYTKPELESQLDSMAKKGLIMARTDKGTKTYANAMLLVGIFEFQVDKLTDEFVKYIEKYMKENWILEYAKIRIPQLRTIPVGLDIDHNIDISSYDDIKRFIKDIKGLFMVANCVCRQAKDIVGEPCSITSRREICLAFGYGAQIYIENGWGREISKEESIKILRQNEEEGLVFQTDNSEDDIVICSCCNCCCLGVSGLKNSHSPGKRCYSNYYAQIETDSCVGCGVCVERCPMIAISLGNSTAVLDPDRCIGCGNCVVTCESEAISLRKKEKEHVPFKTMEELYASMLDRRKILKQR